MAGPTLSNFVQQNIGNCGSAKSPQKFYHFFSLLLYETAEQNNEMARYVAHISEWASYFI